jgi:hypothetical protein
MDMKAEHLAERQKGNAVLDVSGQRLADQRRIEDTREDVQIASIN